MKRIIRLDPSTQERSACLRNVQLVNRQGWVPNEGSAPLDFGQALHRAIGAWSVDRKLGQLRDTESYIRIAMDYYVGRMCLKAPPRDPDNLQRVLKDYFEWYQFNDRFDPLMVDGKVAVELPFSLPLYSTPDTDVLLCGVIDAVGIQDDELGFKDVKHSSTNKIDDHLAEQLLRPQFHVYSYALHTLGFAKYYPPVIVDAIYISKQRRGGMCRRTNMTAMEPHLVENTIRNMRHFAKVMAELPDDEPWPENYSACHGKYSQCMFMHMCQLPHNQQQIFLDNLCSKRDYNPATFGD